MTTSSTERYTVNDVEMYREQAGWVVGGVPVLIALVGSYLPAWRRGFATTYRKKRGGLAPYHAVILALLAGALLGAGFAWDLRRSTGVSLFAGHFWGGVRDGVVVLGLVLSGIVAIALVIARALIMKSRGTVAYDATDFISFGRLKRMWREAHDALSAELSRARPENPAAAQAAACMDIATRLVETRRPESSDALGAGDVLAATVLARAGLTALRSGAPIPEEHRLCKLNPLHGLTAESYRFAMGSHDPDRPLPLCTSCHDRLTDDPDFNAHDRALQLPVTIPRQYWVREPFLSLDHNGGITINALLRCCEKLLNERTDTLR